MAPAAAPRPAPHPRPVPPGHAAAGLRLTARGRSVVAACAVVLATLLWFAVASLAHAASQGAPARPSAAATTLIVVQPGQTLWSIATRADPAADPRLVIQRIVALNSLRGDNITTGQRLWVPRS